VEIFEQVSKVLPPFLILSLCFFFLELVELKKKKKNQNKNAGVQRWPGMQRRDCATGQRRSSVAICCAARHHRCSVAAVPLRDVLLGIAAVASN
jgi:hypothetical protein